MHRLFIALRLPAPLRAAITALPVDIDGAHWQDDLQLHVTLRFIGDVERPLAEDIATALGTVRAGGFDLSLGAPGRFDRRGRLDTLWLAAAPRERLAALHHKLDRLLGTLGLPPEGRAYLPHVTVARFGRRAGDPSAFFTAAAALAGLSAPAVDFALYESRLGPDGAAYDLVARYPLG